MPLVDGVAYPDPEIVCPQCSASLQAAGRDARPVGKPYECFDCAKGWTLAEIATYIEANP